MQAGSQDYLAALTVAGLPVTQTRLPAGDVEVIGRGPEGRPLAIGVELKKVDDYLKCVRDGRLAEQLRGMKARNEIRWLLIEGDWKLSSRYGQYSYQEVFAHCLSMTQSAGALLWRSADQQETVEWLRSLYWWWTSKDYEDHRAHLDWYKPPYLPSNAFDDTEPSMTQKVAAALLSKGPTVDVNSMRAQNAAKHFSTLGQMLRADERTWREIDGIGPKLAKRIIMEVNS